MSALKVFGKKILSYKNLGANSLLKVYDQQILFIKSLRANSYLLVVDKQQTFSFKRRLHSGRASFLKREPDSKIYIKKKKNPL